VLFSAYPALRRHIPLTALQPKYFAAGFEVMTAGRATVLGHPLFDPTSILGAVRSGVVSLGDIQAMVMGTAASLGFGDRPLPAANHSTRRALERWGASDQFIDRVIAPLFGGISLDRSLSSDSAFWGFVLRSMVCGRVFLPAYGIGQLTQALASRLPATAVRLHTRVTDLLIEENRVVGVAAGDDTWRGDAVVVATEAPAAQSLTGLSLPEGQRSCTTAYFAGDTPVSESKRLILNSESSLVNHVVQLTNVSARYAPRGKHLLSATALDVVPGDDAGVAAAMLDDVRSWLPRAGRVDLQPVAVVRVPYAQFEQGPGIYGRLPGATTAIPGLYLAGESLHSSSVQGAIRGGELAASAVLASMP
jgi:phytoene dehydrogenase-like protein